MAARAKRIVCVLGPRFVRFTLQKVKWRTVDPSYAGGNCCIPSTFKQSSSGVPQLSSTMAARVNVQAVSVVRRCASAIAFEDDSREPYKHVIKVGPHTLRGDLGVQWNAGGTAPEPKDYALAGLALCTSMVVRLYADKKKWPLHHIKVVVEELGKGRGMVPEGLQVLLKLDGELTQEQRNTLLEISGSCPVKQMLTGKMKNGIKSQLSYD